MKTARVPRRRALLACLLALALAFGLCPGTALAQDSPASDVAGTAASADTSAVSANLALYGPDGSSVSAWIPLTAWSGQEGATAADMTEALFEANGVVADIQQTEYGFYLNSITGSDGTVYGYDAETGAYWGLYVNGVASAVGADGVVLEPGDSVVWYYGPYAETLPDIPAGFRPYDPLTDYEAAWGSFAGEAAGAVSTELPITSQSARLAWSKDLLRDSANFPNVSGILVVGGMVYVAESDSVWGSGVSNAVLNAYDAATGELKKTMELPRGIGSTCRMAYQDGVIAIPLSDGGLLGVAADTLSPRWVVESQLDGAQSLNSVAAHDGVFVHSCARLDSSYSAAASSTVAVKADSGALVWRTDAETGSYWSGAAVVGGVAVIGTDAGTLRAFDVETGAVLSETVVAPGARVRSEVVPCGEDEVVVSTSDGRIVKARVGQDGGVTVAGSASFAASSTSTPAIVDGTAVVGGATADYQGVLAEVDLETMEVAAVHAAAADVKSAPVVAKGADGANYAYFTCNTTPGALYGVRLGSAESEPFAVLTPAEGRQNYCMASAASDGQGRLFYANDSGVLFAVERDVTCGFEDVAAGDWVTSEGLLERVVAAGVMLGDAGSFRPWDAVTRGEAVVTLHRLAGEPASTAASAYADVEADAFYYNAVGWAREVGVASGYDDGSGCFGPNDPITREQLATMLANFATVVGGVDVAAADPAAFEALAGSDQASSWARTGLVWCCANGIITGDASAGVPQLNPQGVANRSMMAKTALLTAEAALA